MELHPQFETDDAVMEEIKSQQPVPTIDSISERDAYDFTESASEIAKKRGQIVVFPLPNELQLDADSEEAWLEIKRRIDDTFIGLEQVEKQPLDYPKITVRPSPSGLPNCHVTLTFDTNVVFDEWQRIAMQAALGDDPLRVYLNVKRKLYGEEKPTRLFEKPDYKSNDTDQKETN